MRSMPSPSLAVSPRAAEVPAVGYDPARLAVLRSHTSAAIESLRWLTSEDPAAWEAVLAARVTREHLEQIWMPLIDRIIGSDAMVTWPGAELGAAVTRLLGFVTRRAGLVRTLAGLGGAELGETLADMAQEIMSTGKTDDMTALSWALVTNADDLIAMTTFFAELGGAGTARLLMELGVPDPYRDPDSARGLAAVVRARLARATQGQGVRAGFAPALIEGIVAGYDDMRMNPAETLSFVLHDVDYGGDFLVGVTRAVVEHEQAAAADDPSPEHLPWPFVIWSSRLAATLDGDVDETGSSPMQRAGDPMYVLMEALARNGTTARAIFTDPEVARYLLAERRFDLDGLARLAAAAESAAAGPDVVPDAPAPLLKDAALVASAFVNHMGARADLLDEPAPEVSASAAVILGRHLFAVHKEVLVPQTLREPATMRRDLDAFGPDVVVEAALFDAAALAAVADLAVDTDDALATMRAALAGYENGYAAAAAAATSRLEDTTPGTFLDGVIRQIGRLEAYLVERAGHRAEAGGRDRDRMIKRWVDLGSSVLGAGVANAVPVPVLDDGLDHVADDLKDRWATHEAGVEREFEEYADAATRRLTYLWYRELYAAGVITPDLPDAALADDGGLVSWDEFQRLDDVDRRIVQDRMEENTWRGRVDIDSTVLADAIKSAQQDVYAGLN